MSRHACGSSTACFDQLSGTSSVLAIGAFRPERTSTSNTASNAAESLDPPAIIGLMSSAISPNAPLAVLDHRYELVSSIAKVHAGMVYRAVDRHLGRPVAVKLVVRFYDADANDALSGWVDVGVLVFDHFADRVRVQNGSLTAGHTRGEGAVEKHADLKIPGARTPVAILIRIRRSADATSAPCCARPS